MAKTAFRSKGVTVEVIDRGWNRIQRELADLDNSFVKVGVLSTAGTTRSPAVVASRRSGKSPSKSMSMAKLAAIHEYGAPRANIPSRPFMKQAFDVNRAKLSRLRQMLLASVYSRSSSARQALGKLGAAHAAHVKLQFVRGSFAALKPATVKRKGSSKPLIDTGALRNSIDHEVVMR